MGTKEHQSRPLLEIASGIEDATRRLVGHDGLSEGDALLAGMGFPTGLNIDNVVAHYSPNAGCKTVLNNLLALIRIYPHIADQCVAQLSFQSRDCRGLPADGGKERHIHVVVMMTLEDGC